MAGLVIPLYRYSNSFGGIGRPTKRQVTFLKRHWQHKGQQLGSRFKRHGSRGVGSYGQPARLKLIVYTKLQVAERYNNDGRQ